MAGNRLPGLKTINTKKEQSSPISREGEALRVSALFTAKGGGMGTGTENSLRGEARLEPVGEGAARRERVSHTTVRKKVIKKKDRRREFSLKGKMGFSPSFGNGKRTGPTPVRSQTRVK